jgi:hypothetical protein
MVLTESAITLEKEKFAKVGDEIAVKTINLGTLVPESFDSIVATYPDTVTEVYTYKTGGVSGTTVAVVTVVYTTSTKDVLTSVVRS